VGNGLYGQHLKRKALHNIFHKRSALFLKRIGERGLIGQENTLIGLMNSEMRSFGAIRRGLSLVDIRKYGLHAKLERKKSTTRIMYNTVTKGRLDGCFRGQ
jgi:hypothetical protein